MNYLREEGEESRAYLQRLIVHYSSRAILEERLDSLAREWKMRYMKQINLIGKHKASTWWRDIVESMEKKRGKVFVADLRLRMNKLKESK